jgi:hypothetical protein
VRVSASVRWSPIGPILSCRPCQLSLQGLQYRLQDIHRARTALRRRPNLFKPDHRRPEFGMLADTLRKNRQDFMPIPAARYSRMTKTPYLVGRGAPFFGPKPGEGVMPEGKSAASGSEPAIANDPTALLA